MNEREYSVHDWAEFQTPNGIPVMPEGNRRERVQFFRLAGRKINAKLEDMPDVEERINYLTFVKYDASERQIQTESREADNFLTSLDERLRQAYSEKLRALKAEVEDLPLQERITRLRRAQARERQRLYSDASAETERFIQHVEDEIELARLAPSQEEEGTEKERPTSPSKNKGGRPPLWTDDELQELIEEIEEEHKDEALSHYRVAQILIDEKGVDYSERRARDRVKELRKERK